MNRFAVFAEEHGIRHRRTLGFAGVVFNLSEDLVMTRRCLLAGLSGDNVELINQFVRLYCIELLLLHIDQNFFIPCSLVVGE